MFKRFVRWLYERTHHQELLVQQYTLASCRQELEIQQRVVRNYKTLIDEAVKMRHKLTDESEQLRKEISELTVVSTYVSGEPIMGAVYEATDYMRKQIAICKKAFRGNLGRSLDTLAVKLHRELYAWEKYQAANHDYFQRPPVRKKVTSKKRKANVQKTQKLAA